MFYQSMMNRYIKAETRTYGDKVYTNFCGLNVPEDNIECESFTVISIDSSVRYENKQMTYYLDDNLFEPD